MSTFNDISRYADGDMTAYERSAFEAVLASDESLRQELALYREVHGSLQQHFSADVQRDQLQGTLHSLQGEFFGEASQPAKMVSIKRWLRGAVAVAAVLIAVVFMWQPWKPGLYNEFAETSMVAPAVRGENTDNLLQEAATAFNKKEYAKAATLLQQVKQQDPANSFVNFYYGVSLLQTNRITEARELFNQLYAGQSAFKFEAAFYQALGYLKEDNKTLCKEWLQKIPADAPNYSKAQELSEKL
jgi:tetratricopeptide (TPR) repeat protein